MLLFISIKERQYLPEKIETCANHHDSIKQENIILNLDIVSENLEKKKYYSTRILRALSIINTNNIVKLIQIIQIL